MAKSINELKTLFTDDDDKKSVLALKLIDEAIFMDKVLKELKKVIKAEGYVSKFEQGTQKFDRESQALKSYNTTIKNYQSTIKQINDLLPVAEVVEDENEFSL